MSDTNYAKSVKEALKDYLSENELKQIIRAYDVIGDIACNLVSLTKLLEKQDHWDFSYYMRIRDESQKHQRN